MSSSQRLPATALAGRRIDAQGAHPPRFPLERANLVPPRIREVLTQHHSEWLVSSAASGSDLIAQEVAGELGIRRRVVLPFSREEFRSRSVIDRPGDWGSRFDRLIQQLEAEGNVLELDLDPEAPDVYRTANEAILDQALALGSGDTLQVLAIIVWEGQSRGPDDNTAAFLASAEKRGIQVRSVLTTP